MNHSLSRAALSGLAWALAACSTPFGYRLELQRGLDRASGADEIFMEPTRIEGLGSSMHALVIPEGWRSLARTEVSPGVEALVRPVEFEWTPAPYWRSALGILTRRSKGQDPFSEEVGDGGMRVYLSTEIAAAYPELALWSYDEIHERLAEGRDAYAIVPRDRALKRGFAVFAAVGPPLAWVKLGDVTVKSGEGPIAHGLARSVGALAWGLDAAAIPLSYVVGIALFWGGGLAVFEQPPELLETPW